MRDLVIIVAYSLEGRVIGLKGVNGQTDTIPFSLMSDKILFKKTTWGHSVISGRPTYESIPDEYRPLEGRRNIVVSRNFDYVPSRGNVKIDSSTLLCRMHSLDQGINLATRMEPENPEREIFIGGGGEIYKQVLEQYKHRIKKIAASEVHGKIAGDVFFSEIDPSEWRRELIKSFDMIPGKNSHAFDRVDYTPIE